MAQTSLATIINNIAQTTEKQAQIQLADDLKTHIGRNLQRFPAEVEQLLNTLSKPACEAAVRSRSRLNRLPLEILDACEPVRKAGFILVNLKRAKSTGDNKRAYHILWAYVWHVCHGFADFHPKADRFVNLSRTLAPTSASTEAYEAIYTALAAARTMMPSSSQVTVDTVVEEERLKGEKQRAFQVWHTQVEPVFAQAVEGCCSRPSASMAEQAGEREYDLARLCSVLSERGHHASAVAPDDASADLGFSMFEMARDGMQTMASGGDD